ncbi:MAG: lycopene cyclase domain-containing protein [Ilumatobacteraceae bacterium]|nr:lycopene cyclase domain-containing protein [Ilumatobacteraceae bacterium]
MPIYPVLAVLAAIVVVALEFIYFRSAIFRSRAYWVSMAIVLGFMIAVDGWLTKLSAPIVFYNDANTSGIRPVWDILIEEYAFAFALLTMVILLWERSAPAVADKAAAS